MATATETALEAPPTILATDVEFNMTLASDGRVEVAKSPWRVVPGSAVPQSLRLAAEAVVLAEFDYDAARAALAQVEVDGLPREVGAHRRQAKDSPWERLWLAQANFESAVCRYYRWAVVVVLDRGVWLTESERDRPIVATEPLGGKCTCVMCHGLGREKAPFGHPTAPLGSVVPCSHCEGVGVRAHAIPAWIVEGLARTIAKQEEEALAAEAERLDAEF